MTDQYPKILKQDEIDDLINQSKNKDRLTHMNREIEILQKQLNKYQKVRKNYTKYDNLVKAICMSLATISAVSGIAISTVTPFGLIPAVTGTILSSIFGSLTIIKPLIYKVISINFTLKKNNFKLQLI